MPKYNDFELDLQKTNLSLDKQQVDSNRTDSCLRTYACPESMPEGCILRD